MKNDHQQAELIMTITLLTRLVVAVSVVFIGSSAFAVDVRYPTERGRSVVDRLEFQVLELALAKADGDYTLVASDIGTSNEIRQRTLLTQGQQIDVAWFGTTAEFEEQMLPVRIPIDGGLIGWRLFLIKGGSQHLFSDVSTITDLQEYSTGQGPGWGDIPILEAAGIEVQISEYENLFRMVAGGRIDAFPRGAHEAFAELVRFGPTVEGLAVEETLVLRYPAAIMFFVNNENVALHDAIEQGLMRAHDDGSYAELFNNHPAISAVLNEANLEGRNILHIDNPTMTPQTLAIDDRYWFNPTAVQ
jgi:hypothetical protein